MISKQIRYLSGKVICMPLKLHLCYVTLCFLDKFHTLESLMRALEQNTRQEIQKLKKAVVKIFEKIEEVIETDEQGQKVQGQDLASTACARV